MTDPDPRLDELLSAHLDGETTAADAARIAADPALRRRLDELAAARDAVRAGVVPLADEAREAVIAGVFRAFEHDLRDAGGVDDVLQAAERESTEAAAGRSLTRHRSRRFDPSRLLAAAAAVVAVALLGGVAVMLAGESGRGDDAANSAGSASIESGPREATTMDAAGAGDTTSLVPGADLYRLPASDLGAYRDVEDLRRAVEGVVRQHVTASGSAPSASEGASGHATPSDRSSCTAIDGAVALYTAMLDDEAVFVLVTTDGASVLDQATCSEVLRVTPQ